MPIFRCFLLSAYFLENCTVPYTGVDEVKVKVSVEVKVNVRRRPGGVTPRTGVAKRKCSVRLTGTSSWRPQSSARDSFPLVTCGFLQKEDKRAPKWPFALRRSSQPARNTKLCTSVSEHRVWHSEGIKNGLCIVCIFSFWQTIFP